MQPVYGVEFTMVAPPRRPGAPAGPIRYSKKESRFALPKDQIGDKYWPKRLAANIFGSRKPLYVLQGLATSKTMVRFVSTGTAGLIEATRLFRGGTARVHTRKAKAKGATDEASDDFGRVGFARVGTGPDGRRCE